MITGTKLTYFIESARERSFTAAAKKLFITQQTLCSQINQIEEELGVRLFERTRPLTLTPSGECFLKYAVKSVLDRMQLEKELSDINEFRRDRLRIGISHAYSRALLPEILEDYYRIFPDTKVEIHEQSYQEMVEGLLNGNADMIFCRTSETVGRTGIVNIPLPMEEELLLYAPVGSLNRSYGDDAEQVRKALRETSGINAVADCPFILPASGSVRESADRFFAENKIIPYIRIEVSTLETAIILCSKGYGITFSPACLLLAAVGGDTSPLTEHCYLLDGFERTSTLAISYKEGTYVSQSMKAFIDAARQRTALSPLT